MQRRELLKISGLMLGAGVSTSCTNAVLSGADLHSSANVTAQQTLDEITVLSELILPATDTPGAIDAGVPNFVSNLLTNWYINTERDSFMAGLAALNKTSQTAQQKNFVAATTEQQTHMLTQLQQNEEGKAFFSQLREAVVVGYFTSEVGATQTLNYNPMPGSYDGAYPIAKVRSHWSS